MNPIQFECPECHAINDGDQSLYGQRVQCRNCHAAMVVPRPAAGAQPRTARLVQTLDAGDPPAPGSASPETEIFELSPVARAFPGQLLLAVALIGLGIGLATQVPGSTWPNWIPLVPVLPGLLLLLVVWARVKSCSYRLTTERLFVRRGWLAKQVNELELYRVKDVVVDQRAVQRLLGFGTITVLADDDSTPAVVLAGVAAPVAVKEMIRNQYRSARQREGVRPTEFLRSPGT